MLGLTEVNHGSTLQRPAPSAPSHVGMRQSRIYLMRKAQDEHSSG
jgi:hypothetical protein